MTMSEHGDYVVAGFRLDLFNPWVEQLNGDEWGEMLESFLRAADACISLSCHDRALTLLNWVQEELQAAHDQEFGGGHAEIELLRARKDYTDVVAYWRERAVSFDASEVLEEHITWLPAWVLPPNEVELLEAERARLFDVHAGLQVKLAATAKSIAAITEKLGKE